MGYVMFLLVLKWLYKIASLLASILTFFFFNNQPTGASQNQNWKSKSFSSMYILISNAN